jgi:outer membrane receptor protein involved in Fe transport
MVCTRWTWPRLAPTVVGALVCGGAAVAAADPGAASASAATSLDTVVVASTPLAGSDVDERQLATASRALTDRDVLRTGIPSLTTALTSRIPSVFAQDVEGNAFQPDILFRGFTASPVAGTPQGLAIYVNGVRFNDPFGDTVNWDLIPPSAISTATVQGPNPAFGLNALGGSLNVRLKNGFANPGASVTAYGGSFGRRSAILEAGAARDAWAVYAVGDATHDDGYRRTSESDLYRFYADLGWRRDDAEAHLGLTAAHNRLGNPGATPIEALAADRAAIFTAPNTVDNKYYAADLAGSLRLGASGTLEGLAYYHRLDQAVPNGITEQVSACDDGSNNLCNDDGSVVTTTGGVPVHDFLNGGPYSGLSEQRLHLSSYGAALQWTSPATIAGHANRFVAGVSEDAASSRFDGSQTLGGFDPLSRAFLGPGVLLVEPDQGINPVAVKSVTHTTGVFFTDVLTVASDLDLNLAARYNDEEITLEDLNGGPVSGRHRFGRLNPLAGLAWQATRAVNLYASYAETNRAPTPQELSCASAAYPCSLLNFFVGDPDLKQVVARTFAAGVRARPTAEISAGVEAFRSDNRDDIIYEAVPGNANLAFYTNAGRTRRQGLEANAAIEHGSWRAALGYAYTDATFRTALSLNGGSNPAQDANGVLAVPVGSHLPGVPRHRATLTVDVDLGHALTLGGGVVVVSPTYRYGDEGNATPPLAGFTVLDANLAWRLGGGWSVFAVVNNLTDRRYETYGAFGPVTTVPWPAVPGGVTDPRTACPAAPRALYAGIRWGR